MIIQHNTMMSSKAKLKCEKIPLVLRYHVSNKKRYAEECAHHMLLKYLHFKDEEAFKCNSGYDIKLNLPSVIEVVISNCSKVEPYATIVEYAFERLAVVHANIDPFENDASKKMMKHMINGIVDFLVQTLKPMMKKEKCGLSRKKTGFGSSAISIFADNMINKKIISFSDKQCQIFDIVQK